MLVRRVEERTPVLTLDLNAVLLYINSLRPDVLWYLR